MPFIIAAICMTIDHIGYRLFPSLLIFRIIGRIAMPIFAYGIARGYKHLRSDPEKLTKYIQRIGLLAIISQIPYSLLIHDGRLNVCVTWLIALLVMKYGEKIALKREFSIRNCCTFFVAFVFAIGLPMDYGLFGVLNVLAFCFMEKDENGKFVPQSVLRTGIILLLLNGVNVIFTMMVTDSAFHIMWKAIEFVSILSLVVICMFDDKPVRMNKLVKYSFYPAHMMIIYLISLMLKGA